MNEKIRTKSRRRTPGRVTRRQPGCILSSTDVLDVIMGTGSRVRNPDIKRKDDGREGILRPLSESDAHRIALDDCHVFLRCEGKGKTSGKRTVQAFNGHIKPGSRIIHDLEKSHQKLVGLLGLENEAYDSRKIKGLPDSENPLNPGNQLCRLLKLFLRSHSGFIRDDLQGYLSMSSFILNPPDNGYEKVDIILELGFRKSVLLRYRDDNRKME